MAIVPSDCHILLPEGFETGWIYEIVYTGRDPLVMNLGHAAVRDFVSFLKNGVKMRLVRRTLWVAAWRRLMPGGARKRGAVFAT